MRLVGSIAIIALFTCLSAILSRRGGSGAVPTALRLSLPAIVFIYTVSVLVRVLRWRKRVSQRDPLTAIAILLATVVLNSAIIFISPVNDGWYYLGDAVCILGLIVSSIGMLKMYNVSTTRPLPKLFDRAEV